MNYMLVKCLRSKIACIKNKSTVLRSTVLGFEFKIDGFWHIKSAQQILVESINEWLLKLPSKLLRKSLWPLGKESLFVHHKYILVIS